MATDEELRGRSPSWRGSAALLIVTLGAGALAWIVQLALKYIALAHHLMALLSSAYANATIHAT